MLPSDKTLQNKMNKNNSIYIVDCIDIFDMTHCFIILIITEENLYVLLASIVYGKYFVFSCSQND